MRSRLLHTWRMTRSSYWFIPSLMAIAAMGLAYLMVYTDERIAPELLRAVPFVYVGQASGARSLLSTVAGSMISIAGVTFSITLAVLSLTSQQFGPRLLNNFMRDRGNQIVLGTFIATFLYCVLILRTVRDASEVTFVPHLSLTLAVVLSIMSLGVFIYFIHHMAESIRASTIIGQVAEALEQSINQAANSALASKEERPSDEERTSSEIKSGKSGYLQPLDYQSLLKFAEEHDLILEFQTRSGDFVAEGSTLLVVKGHTFDSELQDDLSSLYTLGSKRLQANDIPFLFDQLLEIGLRALSPGVNDPFTAVSCIDRITQGFLHLFNNRRPSAFQLAEQSAPRLFVPPLDATELLVLCFGSLRYYADGSLIVYRELLRTMQLLDSRIDDAAARRVLGDQIALTLKDAKDKLPEADLKILMYYDS